MHRPTLLLPFFLLSACAAEPDIPAEPIAQSPTPVFDPAAFFTGPSRGEGRLKVIFDDTVPIAVRSSGRMEGAVLVLDQTIREGAKSPRERQWRLRRTGSGVWEGSLTDTVDTVRAEVEGNRLTIRYTMDDGMGVRQDLTLSDDGMRAYNSLHVRYLGLTVARLEELIARLPTADEAATEASETETSGNPGAESEALAPNG